MVIWINGMAVGETQQSSNAAQSEDSISAEATTWMLALGVAQLHSAIRDGDASVQSLSGAFTEMLEAAETIGRVASEQGIAEDSPLRQHDRAILEQAQKIIIAFQFYDRLAQRVGHVAQALEGLAELTGSPELADRPEAWSELQERIYNMYSTSEERDLFEALSAGAPIAGLPEVERDRAEDGDVELF